MDEEQKHALLERFWEAFSFLVQGTLAFVPIEDWSEMKMLMQERTSVFGVRDTALDDAIRQALFDKYMKKEDN